MRRRQHEAGPSWGGDLPRCLGIWWIGAAPFWLGPWATSSSEDELSFLSELEKKEK